MTTLRSKHVELCVRNCRISYRYVLCKNDYLNLLIIASFSESCFHGKGLEKYSAYFTEVVETANPIIIIIDYNHVKSPEHHLIRRAQCGWNYITPYEENYSPYHGLRVRTPNLICAN